MESMTDGFVDPEPILRQRLEEDLGPLRLRLAEATTRRERWRIRRELHRVRRRIHRTLGGHTVRW
jgi:hypothetical protein